MNGGLVIPLLLLLLALMVKNGEAAVGVNWGTLSQHRLSPKTVVDLLKLNKISKVKIFDTDPEVLYALRGTQIQVMVGIPNEFLSIISSSSAAADSWVHHNLSSYVSASPSVDIRWVFLFFSFFLNFHSFSPFLNLGF